MLSYKTHAGAAIQLAACLLSIIAASPAHRPLGVVTDSLQPCSSARRCGPLPNYFGHLLYVVFFHIYISRLCYDVSVRLSFRLSVTEVHWYIIANLGFKFLSKFTACKRAHCGRSACGKRGGVISRYASHCLGNCLISRNRHMGLVCT